MIYKYRKYINIVKSGKYSLVSNANNTKKDILLYVKCKFGDTDFAMETH